MYEHLNLKAWPFQVVPDPQFAQVWAARRETKKQLDRLIWEMSFTPKSALHLLWANFGMGKTHTLFHLQYLCKQTNGKLIPVYVVMPTRARGFLDIYRAIVSEMPFGFLGEQLVRVGNSSSGSVQSQSLFSKSPSVVNALLAIRSGDSEKTAWARQWISAQTGLSSSELRRVGITSRIKAPEDAINALTTLSRLANFKADSPTKLVIMIDEFQRIGELREAIRREINSGLHTYFNENSVGLEIILSFSFGREDNVSFLLSDELKSRAKPQTISLDVLSEEEAIDFMRDLLEQFRIEKDVRWAFPFSPASIKTLVNGVAKIKPITPRRLMMYADHVLTQSQYAHGPDNKKEIAEGEVREFLSDPSLGRLDAQTSETSS